MFSKLVSSIIISSLAVGFVVPRSSTALRGFRREASAVEWQEVTTSLTALRPTILVADNEAYGQFFFGTLLASAIVFYITIIFMAPKSNSKWD